MAPPRKNFILPNTKENEIIQPSTIENDINFNPVPISITIFNSNVIEVTIISIVCGILFLLCFFLAWREIKVWVSNIMSNLSSRILANGKWFNRFGNRI